jgi:hypothetical protein
MSIGNIQICPNDDEKDAGYLIEHRLCFVRSGVYPQNFKDFQRTNVASIVTYGLRYHFSELERKLYVMISANTTVSRDFLLNFDVSDTISETFLEIVLSRDGRSNLMKIKTALHNWCSLLNYGTGITKNTNCEIIVIMSYFCKNVHGDIIDKIRDDTTCYIVNQTSSTRCVTGENNRLIRDKIQEFKQKHILKQRYKQKPICNTKDDGEITETENEPIIIVQSIPTPIPSPFPVELPKTSCENSIPSPVDVCISPPKRKIPKMLGGIIETKYEIKCNNNVQFTYDKGVLKITNGLSNKQHDDIAELIANYFDDEMDCANESKKRRLE